MKILFREREINNFKTPYIIAELGANHNGCMDLAKKMIVAAKENGADCVKFQSWTKDSIFSRKVYNDNCFLQDDYRNRSDFNLESIVEKYSLGENQLKDLKLFCDGIKIDFSSTPFSTRELDFLVDELNVNFIKVASMDLNNYPFIEYIAKKKKPIVLSTGLSTLSEIDYAVNLIKKNGNEQIILLHCISKYPPEDNEVNLNNIDMLRNNFECPIGYSDHTLGVTAAILSAAKGVCIIEKHFTLDKNMEGWDHKVSANPEELKCIAEESKRASLMLGSYKRIVNESRERMNAFRRSIVASRNIDKGKVITKADVDLKRPGDGIPPLYLDFIVGKTAKRDIKYDELIKMEDF